MQFTTASDYASWAGVSAPAQLVVDQANDDVAAVVRGLRYVPDDEGRPAVGITELQRAANVQVSALLRKGAQSGPGILQSASIGSASYTYGAPAPDALDLPPGGGLCRWALQIVLGAPGLDWSVNVYG